MSKSRKVRRSSLRLIRVNYYDHEHANGTKEKRASIVYYDTRTKKVHAETYPVQENPIQ